MIQHTIEPMLSAEEIATLVSQLAAKINQDYQDAPELLLVGLLKGSAMFMADLCRQLQGNIKVDYMAVSSYGTSMESSREVRILKDLDGDIAGRDVLLVEDLIDTGRTLAEVKALLLAREPKSLALCTLLDKPSRRETEVKVDYIGLAIPDEFIVGYGIDYAEHYRHLPYIARVVPTEA